MQSVMEKNSGLDDRSEFDSSLRWFFVFLYYFVLEKAEGCDSCKLAFLCVFGTSSLLPLLSLLTSFSVSIFCGLLPFSISYFITFGQL